MPDAACGISRAGTEVSNAMAEALHAFSGLRCVEPGDTPLSLHVDAQGAVRLMAHGGHGLDEELVRGEGIRANLWEQDTHSGHGRSLQAPLFKALGVKKGARRPVILDATAGLGADAWRLAAAGCRVVACERNPIIHTLLHAGLCEAAQHAPEIADRLTLLPCGEAGPEVVRSASVDAVLYDPMFPVERKAKEKKAMRLIRMVVGDDADSAARSGQMLSWGAPRLAIKRARQAPVLVGCKPSLVFTGKGLRFDVYLFSV